MNVNKLGKGADPRTGVFNLYEPKGTFWILTQADGSNHKMATWEAQVQGIREVNIKNKK